MTGTSSGVEFMADALCTEMDASLFFPEKGQSTTEAKLACGMCDVRDECLEYALANHERHGVWGGKSTRERMAILRASGIKVSLAVDDDDDDDDDVDLVSMVAAAEDAA